MISSLDDFHISLRELNVVIFVAVLDLIAFRHD